MRRSRKITKTSGSALLNDPGHYLFDTLPQYGQTRFLITDEATLSGAPFADIRFEPLARDSVTVKTVELVQLLKQHRGKRPQTHFIFHHAFVCSTLLARCLNQIDEFYALKEPWILRRLADIKRLHGAAIPESHWREMYCTYLPLLAKNYRSGRAVVVKATNVANNLITDSMRYMPEQKILYLYSDVESFIVSNLKKPASTQSKMPGLLSDFLKDSDFAEKHVELVNSRNLSLPQTCALIWVCNIYALQQATHQHDYDGLRTLSMDCFLADPDNALHRVSQHFGYRPSDLERARMTHSEVLGRNAKDTGSEYSVAQKEHERLRVYESRHEEIEQAWRWIRPTVERLGLYEFLQSFDVISD